MIYLLFTQCLLTYSLHPRVGHKATMSFLHLLRSWSITSASPIVRPILDSSAIIDILHVVLRRHFDLFPVGIHLNATFGMWSGDILKTWPNHLILCFWIWQLIGREFVLLYRSSLDILFGQNILHILRRHLVWNTSSLCISFLLTPQLLASI